MISTALSIVAILMSGIGWVIGRKDYKEFSDHQEQFNKQQGEFDVYKHNVDLIQAELNSRSNLVPCFVLDRDNSRVYLDDNGVLVWIHLFNVGKGTAVNAKVSLISDMNHNIERYLADTFAEPNKMINFSIRPIPSVANDIGVSIEVQFSDLVGRKYGQHIYFEYSKYPQFISIKDDATSVPFLLSEGNSDC